MAASKLLRYYKDQLSDFRDWEKLTDSSALVYPQNFGRRMSIDEVALSKGELYTVITNKDRRGKKGCLAAIIRGTKAALVSAALERVPVAIRFGVQEITADLANTMDWICRTNFPNARITADRFHVQQIVHEAVQEMRIVLRRKALDEESEAMAKSKARRKKYHPVIYNNGDTEKQLLARSRYLLFKPRQYWTASQRERGEILFREFPELGQAYDLTMDFREIYETAKNSTVARTALETWTAQVASSKLVPLQSAARTVQAHLGHILNFFDSRETNAGAESFNAKLKGFRSLLRGVSELKFFLFRVEKIFG